MDWSTGVDYWTGVLQCSCVRSRVDYMCSVFYAVVFTRTYALSLAMLWANVLQWYADHHTHSRAHTHRVKFCFHKKNIITTPPTPYIKHREDDIDSTLKLLLWQHKLKIKTERNFTSCNPCWWPSTLCAQVAIALQLWAVS